MADISMCDNQTCSLRKTCYRFNATSSERQSYSDFKPDGDKCDFFILMKKTTNTSFARRIIVEDVKTNNKDLHLMPKKALRKYIIAKYNCSAYYANKVIEDLFKDDVS
jgi:hypothetical protein